MKNNKLYNYEGEEVMDLKELYLKQKNQRYNSVTNVLKSDVKLEMNPVNTLKKNWIVLLVILVLVIGFLLLNFNLKYFNLNFFV